MTSNSCYEIYFRLIYSSSKDQGVAGFLSAKEYPFGVTTPDHRADPAIKLFRQIARLTRFPILHEEPPFIGFETSSRVRAPGQIFSVRRIERRRVGAATGGNFLRSASANRHDKNFVVRARRFDFIDVTGVRDLMAIRRNRIHVLAAEIERRHIVIARRQIARL